MYDRETVELLLAGVCWTHHLHTTRTEKGLKGHSCARNEAFWVEPPTKEPKASIDPNMYRHFDWPTTRDIDAMSEREQESWRARIERSIDPAKRKAYSNPKHSNTVWAELIDMQRGWDGAVLSLKERQALFLYHGVKWNQKEIAANQGVSQRAISYRLEAGLNKILTFLNGVAPDAEVEEVAA